MRDGDLRELCALESKADRAAARLCAAPGKSALAWNLVTSSRPYMEQHPKLTLEWALRCLERALSDLDDGPAENRVRRQFHQLLLAIERDAADSDLPLSETSPSVVESARAR
jgi:hypothetical protein